MSEDSKEKPAENPKIDSKSGEEAEDDSIYLQKLDNLPIEISVVLGKTNMKIRHILKMGIGAIIELDKKVGDTVDLCVNKHVIAQGEIVIVGDNRVAILIKKLVK